MDDLGESVKLRESLLDGLLRHVKALLPDLDEQEPVLDKPTPVGPVTGALRFVDGVQEKLFEILKGYFTPEDHSGGCRRIDPPPPPCSSTGTATSWPMPLSSSTRAT